MVQTWRPKNFVIQPCQLLVANLTTWVNEHCRRHIDDRHTEVTILKESFGTKRTRLTNGELTSITTNCNASIESIGARLIWKLQLLNHLERWGSFELSYFCEFETDRKITDILREIAKTKVLRSTLFMKQWANNDQQNEWFVKAKRKVFLNL